jgi:uncharacterized protein YjbJ (UPF0337 family)
MNKLREKAQGQTMQIVGEMIGDHQLVEEGKEQQRHAEQETKSPNERPEPAKKP